MSEGRDPKERELVPGANKALTTRSSTLVRRGLETLASLPGRIVSNSNDQYVDQSKVEGGQHSHQKWQDFDNRALAYYDAENWIEAKKNWEAALNLLNERNRIADSLDQTVSAGELRLLKEAIPRIMYGIALTDYIRGQFNDAIKKFEETKSLYPNHRTDEIQDFILLLKAERLVREEWQTASREFHEGSWIKARGHYQFARELAEKYRISDWVPVLMYNVALSHHNAGDDNEAKNVLTRIKRDFPQYEPGEVQALLSLISRNKIVE